MFNYQDAAAKWNRREDKAFLAAHAVGLAIIAFGFIVFVYVLYHLATYTPPPEPPPERTPDGRLRMEWSAGVLIHRMTEQGRICYTVNSYGYGKHGSSFAGIWCEPDTGK